MAILLTPNLTPMQRARLSDLLSRQTGLRSAPLMYANADRIAGAWMLTPWKDHQDASGTIAALVAEYHVASELAGYIAGMAMGVRLGRSFGSRGVREPRRSISAEYEKLDAEDRHSVRQLIRRLARGDVVVRMLVPKRASQTAAAATAENIEHAKKWAREMGRAARKGGGR